jgi:hypothetical protein
MAANDSDGSALRCTHSCRRNAPSAISLQCGRAPIARRSAIECRSSQRSTGAGAPRALSAGPNQLCVERGGGASLPRATRDDAWLAAAAQSEPAPCTAESVALRRSRARMAAASLPGATPAEAGREEASRSSQSVACSSTAADRLRPASNRACAGGLCACRPNA